MINLRFDPLSAWPKPPTKPRKKGMFRLSYPDTLAHLQNELGWLHAKNVTIAACVTREEIRQDGNLRSTARPSMPGIIVYFDSKHGPLAYANDTYTDWKDNLRAIGLTLENLRAVERHGATNHGEQYRGYAALPPPKEVSPALPATAESPAALLLRFAGYEVTLLARQKVENDAEFRATVYRAAVQRTHPDKAEGNAEDFRAVRAANEFLTPVPTKGGSIK